MFPSPIERFSPIYQWIYKIALPVALIIWLLPLIAVAVTSVRSAGDITSGNYWGWPTSFNFIENYTAVFNNSPIGKYIFNSFKVTIPTVIGAIVLSSMTGFALAVYKFKANLLIFFMFVAGNFVPFQILMVPVRDLTLSMGFYNTTTGLVLFHIAFQTGFCTLFMRNFIKALPSELIEAARVDGVSELKIFLYVVLPLMRPAMAALSVLIFTFIWNDSEEKAKLASKKTGERIKFRWLEADNTETDYFFELKKSAIFLDSPLIASDVSFTIS